LAKDLVLVLQENEPTRNLLQKKLFEFAMTAEFKLIIKDNTPASEPGAEASPGEINDQTETGVEKEEESEETPAADTSKINDES
jgi:hypothetical protein